MRTPVEVRIDVSEAMPGAGALETAATVYLPDYLGPNVSVMFAFPGGGYSRRYYDIEWPAIAGYSQARYHASRGLVFVACDHLGVGGSSVPDLARLSYEILADANHLTVAAVVEMLRSGSLATDVPAAEPGQMVGIGQSMGGCLLVVQQARHLTFDAIAVMGFSAIHTVIPTPPGQPPFPMPIVPRGTPVTALNPERSAEEWMYAHHSEDEEPALLAAEREVKTRGAAGDGNGRSRYPWVSVTVPTCALTMMSPACIVAEAAAIDVPVLVIAGERDTLPDPKAESPAYARAPCVELFILERSAHMHNFARTRERLWARLDEFAREPAA